MNDSTAALQHLNTVALLATRLSAEGVTVFEHHFDYLAFGSWTIVAGRRKRMFEYSWDGRDGILGVSECIQHSSREQTWGKPELRRLADAEKGNPMSFVEADLRSRFLAEPDASPNGGPATQLANSKVTEGPPSVS
jgi:hypothetical protein